MFNPVAAWAAKQAASYLMIPSPWSVVEFGNQRFAAGPEAIGSETTTKDFYAALGFVRYVALDINTERDSIVADLNAPFTVEDSVYRQEFQLVTNNGTGEHLFNQGQVFRHAHELCSIGGVMLHVLPTGPGWTNHGFYNYEPIIFRDLAAANDYQWLFFALCDRALGNVRRLPCGNAEWPFVEKRPVALERLVRSYGDQPIYMVAAFKRQEALPFAVPLQGKYLKDIDAPDLAERYRRAGG
jgi:hypothetical protein